MAAALALEPTSTDTPFTMSWMDSWSRPSANSKVPAPLYLSGEEVPYCHTCGRVISTGVLERDHEGLRLTTADSKKTAAKKQSNEVKYCSDKCRHKKPGPKDRQIEHTIASLLNGEEGSGIEKTGAQARVVKGDQRLVLTCDEIEEIIFGSRFDPEKIYGRNKKRRTRAIGDPNAPWRSVDMESSDEAGGEHHDPEDGAISSDDGGIPLVDNFNVSHVRPSQEQSEINFSAGGGERSRAEKIEESAQDLERRQKGQKQADEREVVRRAARRVIVFGVEVPKQQTTSPKASKSKSKGKRGASQEVEMEESPTELRKAEALMNGMVVEPSFAKGNWSIRWRE